MLIRHHSVAFTTSAFKQMQMKVISDARAEQIQTFAVHRLRLTFLNGRAGGHHRSNLYLQSFRCKL